MGVCCSVEDASVRNSVLKGEGEQDTDQVDITTSQPENEEVSQNKDTKTNEATASSSNTSKAAHETIPFPKNGIKLSYLLKEYVQHLDDTEKENLAQAAAASTSLIASNSKDANKVLDDPDFSFIKALQTAQEFVVTDPSLPDNPIVYATQGFLNLTGYTLDQVLGKNCRFLQGPETDQKAVAKIRRFIEEGIDEMTVCLLNYRADGTTFWNQFFIAALRDAAGNITNYMGVQCKVSDQYAANVCEKQDEEFAQAQSSDSDAN